VRVEKDMPESKHLVQIDYGEKQEQMNKYD